MSSGPSHVGVSVRNRLVALARERHEDVQLVMTRYANERLLYRLAASPHGPRFVLKGAALFTLWTGKPHRSTRDVDFLGFGDSSEDAMRTVFAEVIGRAAVDDGVTFDPSSLQVGPIRGGQVYCGVRITLLARITTAKIRLPVAFTQEFAVAPGKAQQWSGFVKKSGVSISDSLVETVRSVERFCAAPLRHAALRRLAGDMGSKRTVALARA